MYASSTAVGNFSNRAKLVSWPDQRLEDLTNKVVFILGGSEYEEAIVFAERHMESGAKVVMAFRSLESLGYARSMSQSRGLDSLHLLHLEPLRRESADRCFDYIRDHFGRLDGILVLPRYGNGQHGYSLSTAGDDDVAAFVRDQIVSPVAFASALANNLDRWDFLQDAPALTYITNPSDGHGDLFNDINRAAIEALIVSGAMKIDRCARKASGTGRYCRTSSCAMTTRRPTT